MHLKKIEHLGIAVKDLSVSVPLFEQLLGTPCDKVETVESEGVSTAFFNTGPNKVELLEATREDSAIAKFIEKRGEGIHHVAFEVEDIHAEITRLKAAGFKMIHDEPKEGADNKMIAFLHPKSTNGMLIELCMDRG